MSLKKRFQITDFRTIGINLGSTAECASIKTWTWGRPNVNREAADHVARDQISSSFSSILIHRAGNDILSKFEIQNFYHENYMFISGRKSEDPIGEQIRSKTL